MSEADDYDALVDKLNRAVGEYEGVKLDKDELELLVDEWEASDQNADRSEWAWILLFYLAFVFAAYWFAQNNKPNLPNIEIFSDEA